MRATPNVKPSTFWLTCVFGSTLLAGCQNAPLQAPWPRAGSPSSQAGQQTPSSAPSASATSAPASTVAAPKESEIPGLLATVRNNLDAGDAAAATAELERVLAFDPQHKAASTLMRQLREDPNELYGRESFTYRVQPGDTLASIAQRFMNDRDQFYGLARYNSIDVPRQLQVGQSIRIPGKQPRVMPPPALPAAAAPTAPVPATAPAPSPAVVTPDPRLEQARQQSERRVAIAQWTRQARASMARQDVCGAIAAWNEVLKLDPEDRTAALEREKALDLKKRLPAAKC